MEDERCFVQFLHPGGEHVPDDKALTTKGWNTGPHRRKFLRQRGEYLRKEGDTAQTDNLLFWGEWEPDSDVLSASPDAGDHKPRFIYRPYYGTPPAPTATSAARNTDPFVFGDRFLYSNCQQHTKGNRNRMAHLEHGSVILFGSCINKRRFVLDTVFVVAGKTDYLLQRYSDTVKGKVPKAFEDVTLSPLKTEVETYWPGVESFHRLYYSATPQNCVNGMFSFFPCCPATNNDKGFARPVIQLPGNIKDTLTQSRKYTYEADLDTMAGWWRKVVDQVHAVGLCLGVSATMPPSIGKNEPSDASRQGGRRSC